MIICWIGGNLLNQNLMQFHSQLYLYHVAAMLNVQIGIKEDWSRASVSCDRSFSSHENALNSPWTLSTCFCKLSLSFFLRLAFGRVRLQHGVIDPVLCLLLLHLLCRLAVDVLHEDLPQFVLSYRREPPNFSSHLDNFVQAASSPAASLRTGRTFA